MWWMLGMFYEVKKKVTPEPDNSSHFSVWVVIDESLIDTPVVFTQINNATESSLMGYESTAKTGEICDSRSGGRSGIFKRHR